MLQTAALLFSRATLYVGKYSTSLYASPSLVHDGVTVVVSDRINLKPFLEMVQWSIVTISDLPYHAVNSKCCFVQACSGSSLVASVTGVLLCAHSLAAAPSPCWGVLTARRPKRTKSVSSPPAPVSSSMLLSEKEIGSTS